MNTRLGLAFLLASAAGCRSSLPYPSEGELRRDARTLVDDPRFALYSPYDESATADYAASVRAEIALLGTLIPDQGATKPRLYLAPLEGEALEFWETASNRSLKGAATEGEFAFVYVPAHVEASQSLARAGLMRGGTLRHELTHLYAHRAGLGRGPWFNEGLAQEVESMESEGDELRTHPFPPRLLAARKIARPGAVGELLRWRYEDDLSDVERSRRYVLAQALLRFLFEQQSQGSFLERVRAIALLDETVLLAREPDWLAWLAGLDALERLRAVERSLAASVLPSLAENGAPELRTRAADEFALGLLDDPACVDHAATFLLFFRASALRTEDVAALERSDLPVHSLVAQALHLRRGEPVDRERVRTALERASDAERRALTVVLTLLGTGSR